MDSHDQTGNHEVQRLAAPGWDSGTSGGEASHVRETTVDLTGVPAESQPMTLASIHRALAPGALVRVIPWEPQRRPVATSDLLVGAGFDSVRADRSTGHIEARRARSLPDTVGPNMRLLICGLNPSLYAADAGVGYGRPSNRFWKAAVQAGIVSKLRDPAAALRENGVGMTDLVKRATTRSAELSPEEYAAGADRVARLVEWLEPRVVCFVGFEGYRAAINRHALAGWQATDFGGRPTYVMPSTSGLNARTRPADVVGHLRNALTGPSPA